MTLEQMVAADPLPLAPGAKWTYEVTVKRFDENNKPVTKTLTWTTEVLDAHQANGVTAYRVRGWPTDLASIDDASQAPAPTERTLLRAGNAVLFGSQPEPTLDGAEGWFSWPVIDGQRICPKKEDVYCWTVKSIRRRLLVRLLHRSRRPDVRHRARHGRVALPLHAPSSDQRRRGSVDVVREGPLTALFPRPARASWLDEA